MSASEKSVDVKKDLTVIMPALNEEKNIISAIEATIKALDGFGINGEIIVINDGSTDKTEELLTIAVQKDRRIRIIKHDKPNGIGASFWRGLDMADGNAVIMIPGDNEVDSEEALRYFSLMQHVDMVIPFVYNREVRSVFRNILSLVYRFIINTTFMVNFNYTNGTVIYRKSILKELDYRSSGFFFQTDILVRVVKEGYLFAEVPYKLGTRSHGASKAISFPSLMRVIKGYIRLVKDQYFVSKENKINGFSKDSQTSIRRGNG
jgi:glycosyltransferase involved in cell wall biosynthesis